MFVSRPLQSTVPLARSTGWSTGSYLCTSCTPVDWAVDRFLSWPAASAILAPFDFRSLCYLLSPYRIEDAKKITLELIYIVIVNSRDCNLEDMISRSVVAKIVYL